MELSREIAIANAKLVLKQAGYFVDNLWTIQDVQDRFECDDNTAQGILYDSLTNEYIVEKIYSTITDICREEGIEEIED
jgi:hypothetical protein